MIWGSGIVISPSGLIKSIVIRGLDRVQLVVNKRKGHSVILQHRNWKIMLFTFYFKLTAIFVPKLNGNVCIFILCVLLFGESRFFVLNGTLLFGQEDNRRHRRGDGWGLKKPYFIVPIIIYPP